MTKNIRYFCNLCGTLVEKDDAIGLYWNVDEKITTKTIIEAESHICKKCLAGLVEVYDKLKEATQ